MQTRLFDACACYFPITFKPPADDTFGITSDMLIDALEESMCGVRSLLPIAVPFLVEQLLESELAVGKTHALKALVRLANDYGPR
jgi:DNA repair/transcription protein MET18/MMS19